MRPKPVIGQTLFMRKIRNYRFEKYDDGSNTFHVVVAKVGSKYFYCCRPEHRSTETSFLWIKFMLSDWSQFTDYSREYALYLNEQEFLDEKESNQICKDLREAFDYGKNNAKLSLKALREILDIVKRGD